jgi:hypothetical protein
MEGARSAREGFHEPVVDDHVAQPQSREQNLAEAAGIEHDVRTVEALDENRVCMTLRWREMDSNSWYRGTKAADFRSIPGIVGVSAGLLNDTT